MVKIRRINGRTFKFTECGEGGCSHDSGTYEYRGYRIAMEWFDVGWDNRWGDYHETTVRRWVILGVKPYYQHNFTSISKAADRIDTLSR